MLDNSIDLLIKKLQPLNNTVLQINDVCNNEKSSIVDLCKLVEKDPVLMAKILKMTNSPLYSFKNKINTINQAISLFGMSTTKGLVLKTVLSDQGYNNISAYNINEEQFLFLSTEQSKKAKQISKINNLKHDEERILCDAAFLYEIGKLIFSTVLFSEKKVEKFSKLAQGLANYNELSTLEQEFLKINSVEITLMILKKWQIEEEVQTILKNILSGKETKMESYLNSIVKELNVFTVSK
jgi:HD-like signal output (HDOD) protein